MTKELPSLDHLSECFLYKKGQAKLFWRHRPLSHFIDRTAWAKWNTRYAGKEAFITNVKGYLYAHVDGVRYVKHRIVWKFETGQEPPLMLDHRNRKPGDCSFSNLRPTNNSANGFNREKKTTRRGNRLGVSWDKRRQRWVAHIRVSYKQIWLGYFSNKDAAVQARVSAEKKYEVICA